MKFKKPKFWDFKKPNLISYLLLPFTLPFYLKNKFVKRNSHLKSNVKRICVGNIYIGGTGKTPLSIMISDILNTKKKKVAVVKKFYLNQLDEQRLIKKYSSLIISKNRYESLKEAERRKLDYVIFDDGLQDRSMNYELKIVCFNNKQWIGNGFLVPAGPLRENIQSLKEYDVVILNGDNSKNIKIKEKIKEINEKIKIFESFYQPKNLKEFDRNKDYISFSGIGNNINFQELLNFYNFNILNHFSYPDHYDFPKNEIQKILKIAKLKNAGVITTEKDYLRINQEFHNQIKFLQIELKMYDIENFEKLIIKDI